ncbi:MAG: 16S rRNA processing protein RimM [Rickettsiaceae bacterium H1]|nr:16S rRNA processing protein RimM [Rickettsiaceae bacterium H1]
MRLKEVALITSPRGLKGEISLVCYLSDYLSLKNYSPLTDKENEYWITSVNMLGKRLIAKVKNIDSRTEAEKLRGRVLFADSVKFPVLDSDEFFPDDLLNMKIKLKDGKDYGIIKQCYNFGAGEIIEITLHDSCKTIMLPFDKNYFPNLDKSSKIAVLNLPETI